MTVSAINTQVGGSHYKNQVIQPIELVYMLGESPCFCKVAKYLTRDKNDRVENLKKAEHCIRLASELPDVYADSRADMSEGQVMLILRKFSPDEVVQQTLMNMYLGNFDNALDDVAVLIGAEKQKRLDTKEA